MLRVRGVAHVPHTSSLRPNPRADARCPTPPKTRVQSSRTILVPNSGTEMHRGQKSARHAVHFAWRSRTGRAATRGSPRLTPPRRARWSRPRSAMCSDGLPRRGGAQGARPAPTRAGGSRSPQFRDHHQPDAAVSRRRVASRWASSSAPAGVPSSSARTRSVTNPAAMAAAKAFVVPSPRSTAQAEEHGRVRSARRLRAGDVHPSVATPEGRGRPECR
jgi:hypothetical protein